MKARTALILAGFMIVMPARGQTTPRSTPAKPAQLPPSTVESVAPMAPEPVDAAKDAAIRHLMDITNESKLGDSLSGMISTQVRSMVGRNMDQDRLQKFMVDFDQQFRASVPSSKVIDAVVPIYARNFSTDEINGLVKFYESPLGQKMVQTMTQVSRDSEQAGFNIEKAAALATLQKMAADYPEVDKILPHDASKPAGAQPTEPKPSLGPTSTPSATQKPQTPHP
jgi:uncharacterized protein